jgi:hypothetical protein
MIDRTLANIEQYLEWQRPMIDTHNNGLSIIAEQAIQQRREQLLAQSQRAAPLGIPVKRREDTPKTYAIPAARKKAIPALPPASAAPFTPEPAWAMERYEQASWALNSGGQSRNRTTDTRIFNLAPIPAKTGRYAKNLLQSLPPCPLETRANPGHPSGL